MNVRKSVFVLLTTVLVPFVDKSESASAVIFHSNITVYATVGNTVQLPCHGETTTSTSNWNFHRQLSDSPVAVSINGAIVNGFVGRYTLLNRSNLDFTLEISEVWRNESGYYICSEHNGMGPFHLIHLNVSGSYVTPVATTSSTSAHPTPAPNVSLHINRLHPDQLITTQSDGLIIAVVFMSVLLLLIILPIVVGVPIMCYSGWRLKKHRSGSGKSSQSRSLSAERNSLLERNSSGSAGSNPQAIVLRSSGISSSSNTAQGDGVNKCGCSKPRLSSGDDSTDKTSQEKCWHDIYNAFSLHLMSGRVIHSAVRDFYELVANPELCHNFLAFFAIQIHQRFPDVEAIIGIDTNGFLVSLLAAQELRRPFIPARKLRELQGDVYKVEYQSRNNEKGWMTLQKSACTGQKVIIVDEKLASGGTMLAAVDLVEMANVSLLGCYVVVEDSSHNGRQKVLDKYPKVEIVSLFVSASESPSSIIPLSDNILIDN
jgi:adenine phosphoribosyltransferase